MPQARPLKSHKLTSDRYHKPISDTYSEEVIVSALFDHLMALLEILGIEEGISAIRAFGCLNYEQA